MFYYSILDNFIILKVGELNKYTKKYKSFADVK